MLGKRQALDGNKYAYLRENAASRPGGGKCLRMPLHISQVVRILVNANGFIGCYVNRELRYDHVPEGDGRCGEQH